MWLAALRKRQKRLKFFCLIIKLTSIALLIVLLLVLFNSPETIGALYQYKQQLITLNKKYVRY